MGVAAAAMALAMAATTLVACGETEAAGEPEDGDGGTRAEGSTTPGDPVTPADDSHFDPLNGVDAGCTIKASGPRSGTLATSLARPGSGAGIAWAAPENAREIDGLFARATLEADQVTELLRVTGFGIEVPPTATVRGVVVQLKRQASDTGIADGNIQLWLDGVASARPKYIATPWPRTIVGTHHYGQAVDTWGDDLTPELVNSPGFGVDIFVKRHESAGAEPLEAKVESLRVTVFYCD